MTTTILTGYTSRGSNGPNSSSGRGSGLPALMTCLSCCTSTGTTARASTTSPTLLSSTSYPRSCTNRIPDTPGFSRKPFRESSYLLEGRVGLSANESRFPRRLVHHKMVFLAAAAQAARRYHEDYVPGWTPEDSNKLPITQYFPVLKVPCPTPPAAVLSTPSQRAVYCCLADTTETVTSIPRKSKR